MSIRIIVGAAIALALAGCSLGRSRSAAESAVAHFHQELDQGHYQDIYRATAPQFRQATSEDRFVEILTLVHDRLGAVSGADQTNWHYDYTNGTTTVTLDYNTRFASGQATEHFRLLIGDGDSARLLSYDINSPLLANRTAPTQAAASGKK